MESLNNKRKPVIRINKIGESGNIFSIFGRVISLIGMEEFKILFQEIQDTHSDYEQSLKIFGRKVKIIDDPTVM